MTTKTNHPVLLCEKVTSVPPCLGVVQSLGDGCNSTVSRISAGQEAMTTRPAQNPDVQTTSPPAQKCFPFPLMRMTLAKSLASKFCIEPLQKARCTATRLSGQSRDFLSRAEVRSAHLELGLDEVDHLIVERVERLWAIERDSPEGMHSFERHDGLPSGRSSRSGLFSYAEKRGTRRSERETHTGFESDEAEVGALAAAGCEVDDKWFASMAVRSEAAEAADEAGIGRRPAHEMALRARGSISREEFAATVTVG